MWQAFTYFFAATTFVPAAGPLIDARLKDLGVEMVLDTPGRTGACDVLRFTPDGKQLIAAGDDKVVRVWDCGAGGLTPAAVPVLRWSIFREQRGGIYALDLAPDTDHKNGFRAAIAGIGLRSGSAAVLDSRGKVQAGIDGRLPGLDLEAAKRVQAIWSIAFSPDGKQVVYGASDGSVWLWDLRKSFLRRLGLHPGTTEKDTKAYDPVRLVAFTSPTRVISVAYDGWVLAWDLEDKDSSPSRLFQFQELRNLECAALDPRRKWLAAGGQYRATDGSTATFLECRTLDGRSQKIITLPERALAKRLAFDSRGERLGVASFVTSSQRDGFYRILGGHALVYDLTEEKPALLLDAPFGYAVEAVAFHPDGKRLAVAGGDDHDITLWNIGGASPTLASRISGPGRCLWGVGVSKDFRFLGYRDQRAPSPDHPNRLGQGDWRVFDLKGRRFARPAEVGGFQPVAPLDEAEGWSVEQEAKDANIWYAVKGGVRQKIPLEPQDKLPRCYTFLKADDDHPTRLVVGHLWGMSVFALGKGPPILLRKFAGHQGEVMAVAPSADAKFLVSASRDQTVAIWSLLPQKHQDESGASFEEKGDRLVVKAVAPGSPSWEAHLEPGDSINRFFYGGSEVAGGPKAWLPILENPRPGLACEFIVDRGAATLYSMTTTRQRPLARFFPMNNREWVLSRYYDFYYDCSANGDRFVAWQLSGDVNTTPRFDPLERYRKRFFKPEKVEALFADLGVSPERISLIDIEPPDLAFAASPAKLTGGTVRVSITARPAGDQPEQRLKQVNLWVNGAIVEEWKVDDPQDSSFSTFYDLPAEQLRRGTNVLTVQAYNQADIRRQSDTRIEYIKPEAPGNLYALVVGVGNYKKSSAGLSNLSAGKDAEAVEQLLSAQKKLFATTNVVMLRDSDASRERILEETARLAKVVRPDDTFVLFLGGHGASGQVINGIANGRAVKLEKKISPHLFVFCTHNFALERPLATGLPSEELYREVRRLNCRTLVLLDACHSGTIIEDPVRQLMPEGVGPVILSACEPREPAAEDRILGLQLTRGRAGGIFTIALILALEREFPRADANHDKILTALELNDYLRRRVPGLLKVGDGQGQHPTGSLPELEKNLPVAAR